MNLIFWCITTYKNLIVAKIDWISCYMRSIKWFYTFADSQIPLVNDWVPSSWEKDIIINKLYTKYSVTMSSIVPISWTECYINTFSIFIIDSNMCIFSGCNKMLTCRRKVNTMNWILLFLNCKKFFHWWNMPILEYTFSISNT